MQMKVGKLFWDHNHDSKHITNIIWDQKKVYYSFLKDCYEKGYTQIIITSSIMLTLIKTFVFSRNFDITGVDFMEEDDELNTDIKKYLDNVEKDRAYYHELVEHLNFLSEQSSIEIKRITFKGKSANHDHINFYIQVNGLVGINDSQYQKEIEVISRDVERYLL